MKIIFDKDKQGSSEFKTLTGSYYANNTFDKIVSDIEIETTNMIKIVGKDVYDIALNYYWSNDIPEGYLSDDLEWLVKLVQMPVAIKVTFNMGQKNDVSHESSGRRIKVDNEKEKIPWQWQLEKDDAVQMDNYYAAIDRLIDFLEERKFAVWENSEYKKVANSLFINNTKKFNEYYPVQESGRMYMLLLPFIKEAQRKYIKPALGKDLYNKLLANTDLTEAEKDILECVYPPLPLIAYSLALRRLPLGIIPFGVVRHFASQSQTLNASTPASIDDIFRIADNLMGEAMDMIDDLKKEANGHHFYQIMPNNDKRNPYFIA